MSWDPAWEQILKSQEWGKYPPEELIRFIARRFRNVDDRRTVSILEVGCGTGANVWYLAREGFSVAGIDGSTSAIERAGERLTREDLRAHLVVGDIEEVGSYWKDGSFDAVIDVAALFHNRLSAVERMLAQMHAMVRPGGWVYSSLLASGSWGEGSGTEIEPGTFVDVAEGPLAGRGLVHFFTREEVDRLFSGFSSVEVDYLERSIGGGSGVYKLWNVVASL